MQRLADRDDQDHWRNQDLSCKSLIMEGRNLRGAQLVEAWTEQESREQTPRVPGPKLGLGLCTVTMDPHDWKTFLVRVNSSSGFGALLQSSSF